ncbi:hypothetical protein [Chitinophaga vietnamensis]|uniref:hypothetical protein n=1 Tax=Chitinophaga vietnamensis TaxID=2593957 RepID=UPI00117811EE|nr:hypothetical protein [Chitinophaga vietnamensis]
MRSLLTLTTLLCLTVVAKAQSSAQTSERYCHVTIRSNSFKKRVAMQADYGQPIKSLLNPNPVRDSTGHLMYFDSPTDALNYIGRQGWKLVTAFVVDNDPVYLFKKDRE